MSTIVHNRPNNRIQDSSFAADSEAGKTGFETTNFMSAFNTSTNANNYQMQMQRSKTLPKLSRERSRENKMYRTPPTPPPDKLIVLERSFTLDCIAVGNISEDYSTANPKLGSAIPPYDSRNDATVKNYMRNYGIDDLLKRTGQLEPHESIPGKAHDRFHSSGLGARYLKDRNRFGNGHHPETFEGHRRFMGEQLRNMFSYNNMYGYRRNVPRLRSTPSTFTADKKQMQRISNAFQNHYTNEEIRDHFQNTFIHGYPFSENDFKEYHPNVRYFITVKVGDNSPDQFKDNLNINIIARTYATGFIQLDKSIAFLNKTKDERAKSNVSTVSKKSTTSMANEQAARDRLKLFQKGKEYTFAFEEKDIRTVSGIILAKEGNQELYVDHIILEIHKPTEKKLFRFPYNGWVSAGKQAKKAEDIKRRFGIQNSIYTVPNDVPQFEYRIKTSPQIFSKAEYVTKIECDVEDLNTPVQYRIVVHPSHLVPTSVVALKLLGTDGSTDFIKITDHKLVIREREIGKIKNAIITYENKRTDIKDSEWFLDSLTVVKDSSESYSFKFNKSFKTKEKALQSVDEYVELSADESDRNKHVPIFSGKLCLVIEGDKCATSQFNLVNYIQSSDKKTFTFKTYAPNVGTIQGAYLKFIDKPTSICTINSIKISRNKDIFEYDQSIQLKHEDEVYVPEGSPRQTYDKANKGKPPQLQLKLIGDKHSVDYFTLEDPTPGQNDCDEFVKISRDIGTLKNVHLKYLSNDKRKVFIESIEITNPKGEKYSFPVEMSFKSGDESVLPKTDTTLNTTNNKNTTTDVTKNNTSTDISYTDARYTNSLNDFSKQTTITENQSKNSTPSKEKEKTKTPVDDSTNKTRSSPEKSSPTLHTTAQSEDEKEIEYTIITKTGNKLQAGTDANVYIKINGDKKSTKEMHLMSKSNKLFEMGQKDTFQLKAEDVGKIKNIEIRHDGEGFTNGWYLDSVEVQSKHDRSIFPVERWLAEGEGDGLCALTLTPGIKPPSVIQPKNTTIANIVPNSNKKKNEEEE